MKRFYSKGSISCWTSSKLVLQCLVISSFSLLFAGCSTLSGPRVPLESFESSATVATKTETQERLRKLPPAESPLAVSVYQFSDLTGQNKPGEIPQYSRAVTQGGINILKSALIDAGNHSWFRVLERGGLENLLQERKIIDTVRARYETPDGDKLPQLGPMMYAGLILEGGITAYESNVQTGGVGARFLGIGGDTKYSRDMVTVHISVVSVTTGEVLLSVTTSKTIFSQSMQGGLFKYVSYDKIAEGEAGVTYNEPPQLAVREAVEMGVYTLILEGVKKQLWSFKDAHAGQQALREFDRLVSGEPESTSPQQTAESSRQEQLKKKLASNPDLESSPLPSDTSNQRTLEGDSNAHDFASKSPTDSALVESESQTSKVSKSQDFGEWFVFIRKLRTVSQKELALQGELEKLNIPSAIVTPSNNQEGEYMLVAGPFTEEQRAKAIQLQLYQFFLRNINRWGGDMYRQLTVIESPGTSNVR